MHGVSIVIEAMPFEPEQVARPVAVQTSLPPFMSVVLGGLSVSAGPCYRKKPSIRTCEAPMDSTSSRHRCTSLGSGDFRRMWVADLAEKWEAKVRAAMTPSLKELTEHLNTQQGRYRHASACLLQSQAHPTSDEACVSRLIGTLPWAIAQEWQALRRVRRQVDRYHPAERRASRGALQQKQHSAPLPHRS